MIQKRIIAVEVKPRASKIKVQFFEKNKYKIWLTAQPVNNQANRQLLEVLSGYFGVSKSFLEIKKGKNSFKKLVIIYG